MIFISKNSWKIDSTDIYLQCRRWFQLLVYKFDGFLLLVLRVLYFFKQIKYKNKAAWSLFSKELQQRELHNLYLSFILFTSKQIHDKNVNEHKFRSCQIEKVERANINLYAIFCCTIWLSKNEKWISNVYTIHFMRFQCILDINNSFTIDCMHIRPQ